MATLHKVKITVVRKMDMRDLWGDAETGTVEGFPPVCDAFEVGDEFIVEPGQTPAGFCSGAFADIYRFVSGLQRGADYTWMAKPGEVTVCCVDAFRPVVFKIQRMDG